jgi:hypothetical protein
VRPSFTCALLALLQCTCNVSKATKREAARGAASAQPLDAGETTGATATAQATSCALLPASAFDLPPYDRTVAANAANPKIVDPKTSLAALYERLAERLRDHATSHVRIAIYGDSNMTMDYISGGLRRLLHARFGDAGHGFVAAARPWSWYLHMDVRHEISEGGWVQYSTSTRPASDHHYGIANIAAESLGAGAWSFVETAKTGAPTGTRVSHVEVYYMQRPVRGRFEIRVDGKSVREVDPYAEVATASSTSLDIADAPHRIAVVATKGHVRILGTTFERGSPSVVVDSFGIGSFNYEQFGRVSAVSRDPMLKQRAYDLVVFLVGTNVYTADAKTEADIRAVASAYRAALPDVPLLFMTPPDLIEARPPLRSSPRMAKLGTLITRVAGEIDAASWDFRAAMGGELSIRAFANAGYAEHDYTHLREAGGALMGQRLAHALFEGMREYVASHPTAGCKD